MKFTTAITALLAAAGTSLAAPAPEPDVRSMAAQASSWTIQSFKRTCDGGDKSCNYSYNINANDGSRATACNYKVTGNPASRATYQNVKCGAFTIGSTWSGQFGANKGFQTLSVVKGRQIVYPAYTDAQLQGGKTVSPDQSYPVQNLP